MMKTNEVVPDLNRLVMGGQLPALPQSAIRILELSKNPDNGPSEFAQPIEADPGLAGQVLKFVNSSYFGFSREISSVKLAITLVGVSTIRNFTLWSAVFSLMPNPKCGPFDLKCLWRDSLRRGLFARRVGLMLGLKDAEEAFVAALLQDMAVPLLAKEYPDLYAKLLRERGEGRLRLSDLERERFGFTHADAASQMARQWHLPDGLAELVAQHVSLEALSATPRDVNQTVVSLSALLPASADPLWTECQQMETHYQTLPCSGECPLPHLLAKVDEDFATFAQIFSVGGAPKSLVECYNEVTANAV